VSRTVLCCPGQGVVRRLRPEALRASHPSLRGVSRARRHAEAETDPMPTFVIGPAPPGADHPRITF
jgi:hypothetical protein